MTIPPTLLRQIGSAAFGPSHWQAELASHLQVNPRTVRSWLSGRMKPSPGIAQELRLLLEERGLEIAGAIEALGRAYDSSAVQDAGKEPEAIQRAPCDPTATKSPNGGYGCPFCSCGAVPDWKNEAHLRCTGCKRALAIPDPLGILTLQSF